MEDRLGQVPPQLVAAFMIVVDLQFVEYHELEFSATAKVSIEHGLGGFVDGVRIKAPAHTNAARVRSELNPTLWRGMLMMLKAAEIRISHFDDLER